jgi:hypothetical protein
MGQHNNALALTRPLRGCLDRLAEQASPALLSQRKPLAGTERRRDCHSRSEARTLAKEHLVDESMRDSSGGTADGLLLSGFRSRTRPGPTQDRVGDALTPRTRVLEGSATAVPRSSSAMTSQDLVDLVDSSYHWLYARSTLRSIEFAAAPLRVHRSR